MCPSTISKGAPRSSSSRSTRMPAPGSSGNGPNPCAGIVYSSASNDRRMKRGPHVEALEAQIGYIFRDKQLLTMAMTHVSAVAAAHGRANSYQRLEFLGDRVLGLT